MKWKSEKYDAELLSKYHTQNLFLVTQSFIIKRIRGLSFPDIKTWLILTGLTIFCRSEDCTDGCDGGRYSGDWLRFNTITINPKNIFSQKEKKTDQIHMKLQGASNRQSILKKVVRGVTVLYFITLKKVLSLWQVLPFSSNWYDKHHCQKGVNRIKGSI